MVIFSYLNPLEAIICISRSLIVITTFSNSDTTIHTRRSIGDALTDEGKYGEALQSYQQQLKMAEEQNNAHEIQRAGINIGNTYLSLAEDEGLHDCGTKPLNDGDKQAL